MFAKIQKSLLLRRPLLWNTRIVPLSVGLAAVNLLFFLAGFASGAIDFTGRTEAVYFDLVPFFVTLAAVVVGSLGLVLWLVFYFRHNGFKAFYPRGRYGLFREWLLVLLGCWLICLMPASFAYGKHFRARSYYSEAEVDRRIEVLSRGSFFLDGPFENRDIRTYDSARHVWKVTKVDRFRYRDRSYSVHSLMNKQIGWNRADYDYEASPQTRHDSLIVEKMRDWLYHGRRDSIARLFEAYLAIADEHGAEHSVSAASWLEKTYNAPDFNEFTIIRRVPRYRYYPAETAVDSVAVTVAAVAEEVPLTPDIDTLTQTIRVVEGEEWVYNRLYVPAEALEGAYGEIKSAYRDKYDVFDWMLIAFYVAAGLSVAIFSYRVTSGRDFLIALIATGILGIVETLIGVSWNADLFYSVMVLLTLLAFDAYFFIVPARSGQKKRSGIALNLLLWQLPGILILAYHTTIELAGEWSGYDETDWERRDETFPLLSQLHSSDAYQWVAYGNVVAVVLLFGLLSPVIRRWKGIPEE